MLISLNWLRDFVDIPLMAQPHLYDVVVGHVVSVKKHPNADKLQIAEVDLGFKTHTIVCGATNLAQGQYVPVAQPGVTLPGDFTIGARAVRGVESQGMICSEDELGLTTERQEGIMILAEGIKPGTPLAKVLNIPGYSPKQLGELLTAHTAEVESVVKNGDDYIIEIDNKSLTHRPDLWGHYGIAREFAAILNLKLAKYDPIKPVSSLSAKLEVSCDSPSLCHSFRGIIVSNITVSESPDFIKNRLTAVGINPINNIVDITNYVMAELGQPMHAYDRELIQSDHLHITSAKDQAEFISLHKEAYNLAEQDIIITNGQTDAPIMLAGVMGAANSEINQTTKEIILESAVWPATTIRVTATKYNLRTDASQRYEKALDPTNSSLALARALELLKMTQPEAKIISNIAEYSGADQPEVLITLNFNRVNSYLGTKLNKEVMLGYLEAINFEVVKLDDDFAEIKVPSFRATKDVRIEVDLIEEIGRLHGYQNIQAKAPTTEVKGIITNPSRSLKHDLRKTLNGLGLSEIMNYSFYSHKDVSGALLEENDHIRLKNYLAETQTHMRRSLVPNFLKSLKENSKNLNELACFEIGRTYHKTDNYFPREEKEILMSYAQKKTKNKDQFFALKGLTESLLKAYQIPYQIRVCKEPKPYMHPHQSAEIISNDVLLGHIFTLHPLVQDNFDVSKIGMAFSNLNLAVFLAHQTKKVFAELPKYPDLEFDISVIVPENVTIAQITETIKSTNPELIHQVAIFDIYRGENVKAHHKAVAAKITLRDLEKTLSDDVMAQTQQKAFTALEALGGVIRGK